VASDLPSVREIVTDGQHGRLVRPDRPAELARAIRILLEYPEQRARLGAQARQRIAAGLTWRHATTALADLYRRLCPALAQPVD
jgi:glycosyltransferase involved in cell wall biosynthesis